MLDSRTVSSVQGQPEFGQELTTEYTSKNRALVGWNHQDDTEHGRARGKIWCWVSEGRNIQPKFQVYDEDFNRSPKAGVVRYCGVANFTMVRMFHPYWCPGGYIPKDQDSDDKRMCRERWKRLFRQHRIGLGLPVDHDPDDPFQPPDDPPRPPRQRRRRHRRRNRRQRRRAATPVNDAHLSESSSSHSDLDDYDQGASMFFSDNDRDSTPETADESYASRESSFGGLADTLMNEIQNLQEHRARQNSLNEPVDPIVIVDDDDGEDDKKDVIQLIQNSAIEGHGLNGSDIKVEPAVIDLTHDEPIMIDLTIEDQSLETDVDAGNRDQETRLNLDNQDEETNGNGEDRDEEASVNVEGRDEEIDHYPENRNEKMNVDPEDPVEEN